MEPESANLPSPPYVSKWASRYRGATVEDIDPPAALSLTPDSAVCLALINAFERDYTHLTVVDADTRALLGYTAVPDLKAALDSGTIRPEERLSSAGLVRWFRRGGRGSHKYTVITMGTPLEELEAYFAGAHTAGQEQEFAIITDERRRFVLGVATKHDLEEFVKRRPA